VLLLGLHLLALQRDDTGQGQPFVGVHVAQRLCQDQVAAGQEWMLRIRLRAHRRQQCGLAEQAPAAPRHAVHLAQRIEQLERHVRRVAAPLEVHPVAPAEIGDGREAARRGGGLGFGACSGGGSRAGGRGHGRRLWFTRCDGRSGGRLSLRGLRCRAARSGRSRLLRSRALRPWALRHRAAQRFVRLSVRARGEDGHALGPERAHPEAHPARREPGGRHDLACRQAVCPAKDCGRAARQLFVAACRVGLQGCAFGGRQPVMDGRAALAQRLQAPRELRARLRLEGILVPQGGGQQGQVLLGPVRPQFDLHLVVERRALSHHRAHLVEAEFRHPALAVEDVALLAGLLKVEERLERRARGQLERERARRAGRPIRRAQQQLGQVDLLLVAAVHSAFDTAQALQCRNDALALGPQPAAVAGREEAAVWRVEVAIHHLYPVRRRDAVLAEAAHPQQLSICLAIRYLELGFDFHNDTATACGDEVEPQLLGSITQRGARDKRFSRNWRCFGPI